MKQNKQVKWPLLIVTAILLLPLNVSAQSSSNNYRIEESYFGTGGEVDASSNSYRSRQSTGSLGAGTTSSNGFDAVAGFTTPSEPFLEVAIAAPDVDFGLLSPGAPSYADARGGACNCTFYVRSYLSSDYAVITASPTLTNENGDTINEKGTRGPASTDEDDEEFGINLATNSLPGAMGADPVNEPDDTFADGQAEPDYAEPNEYKYVNGDRIASSPKTVGNPGVGKTNYTISYIAKPSNLTPAGQYTMRHNIVVVPTF